jgi:transposase-like protein
MYNISEMAEKLGVSKSTLRKENWWQKESRQGTGIILTINT